ncbi:hypothetical protein ACEPAH_2443 [Sanghuangporus vaninii]
MHPHSALDPSFLGSFKRLFSHSGAASGCYLDIDMTRRVDWYAAQRSSISSSSPSGRAFLDQPATSPPTCELSILAPELRALVLQAIASSRIESRATTLGSETCSEGHGGEGAESGAGRREEPRADSGGAGGTGGNIDKDIWTLHIRQTRLITVRDVLAALDRFLYAEVPVSYWPEDPRLQERIECAHRLRVKHLARTHGRSARAGARMSMSIMHGKGGAGIGGGHLAPLCFMQVVECAEVDAHGRMVKRDRKVAPRIDWLGGKFFFAGLKKSRDGRDAEADFVLNMEAPWARRRRSLP